MSYLEPNGSPYITWTIIGMFAVLTFFIIFGDKIYKLIK
jgi:hypothetical protein